MGFSLDGKVAIVTGGASGIGLATVKRFLAHGARVAIADLSDASELAQELGCFAVQVDITEPAAVEAMVAAVVAQYGGLDILANNAGVFADYKGIAETDPADFDLCYRVNVLGAFNCLKAVVPAMKNGGAIVNTASLAGKLAFDGLTSYTASKFGIVGLTQNAAIELAAQGIRVNAICPTTVNTPMAHTDGGDALLRFEETWNPMGRICEPEEVAAMIHFLASDDCGFVNGQAINLCGGASAGMNGRAIEKLGAG